MTELCLKVNQSNCPCAFSCGVKCLILKKKVGKIDLSRNNKFKKERIQRQTMREGRFKKLLSQKMDAREPGKERDIGRRIGIQTQ